MDDLSTSQALRTTLFEWHQQQGGRMVEFAGYAMPLHYAGGIIDEHNHTRNAAGLFDVSHMGQIVLRGWSAVKQLEAFVPSDVRALKPGHMRYTVLLNDWGGIIDDLMMIRPAVGDDLWLVVNAGRKEKDLATLRKSISPTEAELVQRDLIALQGPKAADVLRHHVSDLDRLGFMQARWTDIHNIPVVIMRSGYTGEDGFEISVTPAHTHELVALLMRHEDVKPIGLGARDTLRLEAGLCLYGHELNEKITPIEAELNWTVNKVRLSQGEFAGAAILEAQVLNGPEQKRVGLIVDDRVPVREGCAIHTLDGHAIGVITSGVFSPSLGRPIAMGYVESHLAIEGTGVQVIVRGRPVPAHVAPLPFVPHRYYKPSKK